MWTAAKAPSLAEIEVMAHAIFERLPNSFRDLCEGVIIRVEDFPTEEVLDEMQAVRSPVFAVASDVYAPVG